MVKVTPAVIEATKNYPEFRETGKRMVHAWKAGMQSLRLQKTWSLPSLDAAIEQAHFSDMEPLRPTSREKVGRSPLPGRRGK